MKRNFALTIIAILTVSCGGGSGQQESSSNIPLSISKPNDFSATEVSGNVSLEWSLNDTNQKSDIYVATNPNIQYENYASFENSEWIQGVTSPYEYIPQDLGHRYFFVVVAKSNGNESEQSDTASAVPRYIDQGESVADIHTSLVWLKCSIGQTYNSQSNYCDGDPIRLTHDATQTIILNDYPEWRLPSASELFSLVYCDSGSPDYFLKLEEDSCVRDNYDSATIYEEFFPNTKVDNIPAYRTNTRLSVAGYENTRVFQTISFSGGKFSQIHGSEAGALGNNVRLVKSL